MRLRLPRSILGQLLTGLVAVQLVVIVAFLAISVRHEIEDTRLRDLQRLQRQTWTITNVLRQPLATGDRDMLDHIVQALPVSLTVQGVRITDPQGRAVRMVGEGLQPALSVREQAMLAQALAHPGYHLAESSATFLEGVQAVATNGIVHGVVWVRPDTNVTRRFWAMDLRNLATYAGCALLGNLLLVWWLSTSVAKPLRELRHATQQIEQNPGDLAAFPLPARMHNEAGELQASFNTMARELERRRRDTQETLNLLDTLLEHAPVGFAFLDRGYRFVRVNETLAAMNGLPVAAHLNKRYRDLLPPGSSTDLADRAEALLKHVFDTALPLPEVSISGVTPAGGGVHTWQLTLFPVSMVAQDVRWVGVIVLDRTGSKQAEEALRRGERLAVADRLAASIAHEISNPVESITSLLSSVLLQTELSAQSRQYVSRAQAELTRVGEITDQTLESYRHSSHPTDVCIPDLLRSALAFHKARMCSPALALCLRLSDTAMSFGFAGELRQLFAGLVGRALDAMPYGGTLFLRVRRSQRLGVRGTRMIIADTGCSQPGLVRSRTGKVLSTSEELTVLGMEVPGSAETLEKHRAVLQIRSREAQQPGDISGMVLSIFFPYDGVPRGPIRVTTAAQALVDRLH